MLESRMNQVSDQFSRDFNGKASVSYHASQAPRETFISDAGIQGFKSTVKFEQNLQDNMSTLDRELKNTYKIDHRIFALENNAEAAYKSWKKEQDRIQEQRRGEQAIQDAMERLKQEKEFLKASYISQAAQEEVQAPNFNRDYYYPLAASDLEDVNQGRTRYGTQSVGFASPDGKSTAYSNTGSADKRVTFSKIRMTNNDDFNLHQIDKKNLSPWKGFHDHDDGVNYSNVDVEKLEQASKHCSACEAKYRLILNTINPNRQKQKMTDETIRKLLIQLKALFVARKFEEAQDLADTALEDGYRHADIYYMAGEIKRSLKLHREAEACYLQALTFQVHSPYIYQSLGLTYIDLDNHKRAVPLLKHFTDKILSDSACFELGKCLAVCKNYLEATVYFGKAIEINQRVGDYYLHRGDSYEALGFMKLAIDDFRNFRKLVPEYQEVFISNIKALEMQGRYDEANTYKAYLKKIEV